MTKPTTYGMDIAKRECAVYWRDEDSGQEQRRTLKRSQVAEFFAQRPAGVVALEACGAAHYWGRRLHGWGHQVRLLPTQHVKPFVQTNKTDAADARAVWEAAQRPGVHPVAVKTEAQQAVLVQHRLRQQLIKMRTMQVNQLRGLLGEFGVLLPKGRAAAERALGAAIDAAAVPAVVRPGLLAALARVRQFSAEVDDLERQLAAQGRADERVCRVQTIPGVGLLTATAAVAQIGEASAFASGRQFAASRGLVPRQSGTGGRVQLGPISKRGDAYLRSLLIHGARAVLARRGARQQHSAALQARPFNVAVVALANKNARRIWALLAHGTAFDPNHRSVRPARAPHRTVPAAAGG